LRTWTPDEAVDEKKGKFPHHDTMQHPNDVSNTEPSAANAPRLRADGKNHGKKKISAHHARQISIGETPLAGSCTRKHAVYPPRHLPVIGATSVPEDRKPISGFRDNPPRPRFRAS
jgi:hypothetical protein